MRPGATKNSVRAKLITSSRRSRNHSPTIVVGYAIATESANVTRTRTGIQRTAAVGATP